MLRLLQAKIKLFKTFLAKEILGKNQQIRQNINPRQC
jgi:hypothetical protein